MNVDSLMIHVILGLSLFYALSHPS